MSLLDNKLFSISNNLNTLDKFIAFIEKRAKEDEFSVERDKVILSIMDTIASNPDDWDEHCQFSIAKCGSEFIDRLKRVDEDDHNKRTLDAICVLCFRFLVEYDFSNYGRLPDKLDRAKKFVLENKSTFEEQAEEQIEYVQYQMPIAVIKQLLKQDGIKSFIELRKVSDRVEQQKQEFESEIQVKLNEAKELRDALKEYKSGFNFVGLNKGFEELAQKKQSERIAIKRGLFFVAMVALTPLLMEIIFISTHSSNIAEVKDLILMSFFPIASIVLICIYYFRVLLFNYKSINAQLLQLELRSTLCKFIQSYADYSKELQEKAINPLTKFENVIFSGITTDDGALPSTYDGLEHLGKLLESLKK